MDYFKQICNNDYLLSLTLSIGTVLVIYIENKINKKVEAYMHYIKLSVLIAIGIYIALYLKSCNIKTIKKAENVNVNIGEPTF